jgi:hypothetical protein
MVVRSFQKCGLFVKLDGSEKESVNIEGLPNYQYRIGVIPAEPAAEPAAVAVAPAPAGTAVSISDRMRMMPTPAVMIVAATMKSLGIEQGDN